MKTKWGAWVKVLSGRSLIEVVMHWLGWTAAFLALSVVSGRATAQPVAPAPEPVAAAPQPAVVDPGAVPMPEPAPQQGGFPPPGSGRWIPAPDGSYTWVPAGYQLPPLLPYREGQ